MVVCRRVSGRCHFFLYYVAIFFLKVSAVFLESLSLFISKFHPYFFFLVFIPFSFPTEMYIYFITYPLLLITSPTIIILFCPLETVLVLTSDNFHSVFPPSPSLIPFPPGSYWTLSRGTIYTVHSHTFILSWLRKTSVSVKTYQISFWVCICAFHL